MADQQHLDMLKRGVEAWNQWKREYLDEQIIFSKVDLTFADLGGMNLEGAYLEEVDLQQANLSEANLKGADLSVSSFTSANLSGVDLRGAVLQSTEFRGANLRNANLSGADLLTGILIGADLSDANLRNTDLSQADLRWANLSGADLSEAQMSNTILGDVDLRLVKGLETVKHFGPSTIGIDVISRSQGQVPEVFLQGAGVPDTFIAYVRSLAGLSIEYASCFISYSSRDQGFVEQLYADLQSKGVRCWFAPEDLKIGDKIRTRIDESIHLHDKLLLVLSQYSVASQWVEHEVETALARERHERQTILFPIRLDNAVMKIEHGWPALIHNTRNIGDFSRWKRYETYQKALERLLHDLKMDAQQ